MTHRETVKIIYRNYSQLIGQINHQPPRNKKDQNGYHEDDWKMADAACIDAGSNKNGTVTFLTTAGKHISTVHSEPSQCAKIFLESSISVSLSASIVILHFISFSLCPWWDSVEFYWHELGLITTHMCKLHKALPFLSFCMSMFCVCCKGEW